METKKFQFNGSSINFEIDSKNVMVNATEMGKVFNRKVEAFTRNEDTKQFISEALKSENFRFLNIEKEEDLIISRQKSGTWMHRILALKFAAWLNPSFELWVYAVIDDILFGKYAEIEKKIDANATRKAKIKLLRDDLETNPPTDERIKELIRLENEDRKESRKPYTELGKKQKNKVVEMISLFSEKQMSGK